MMFLSAGVLLGFGSNRGAHTQKKHTQTITNQGFAARTAVGENEFCTLEVERKKEERHEVK